MPVSASECKYPPLLIWHYWISLSRILSAFAGLGILLYLSICSPEVWYYYRSFSIHVQWAFTIVVWILVSLNDIFILTIDMKRAYPYLGGIGVQSTLSLTTLIFSTNPSLPLLQAAFALYSHSVTKDWRFMILPGIPATICWILSVCCLGLVIWPVFFLRNRCKMTWKQVLKYNTKDAFLLRADQTNRHHASGVKIQKRVILNRQIICMPFNGLKRYFTRLLFRRIHRVERKSYAFTRNMFAILAMGILVFRAITALIQTKSKIDTRAYSNDCRPVYLREHEVQVLVLVGSTGRLDDEPNIQTKIWIKTGQDATKPCQRTKLSVYSAGYPFVLFSYTCNHSTVFDWSFRPYTYFITANSSNQSPLAYEDMPFVWLANRKETLQGKRVLSPFYSTPWRPLPGYHSELEAGLVSRGFISSPIMRDLVLNADPEYTYISLYPFATLAAARLANSTTATATIHFSMKPGLNYLRNREPFDQMDYPNTYPLSEGWMDYKTCDFIEDYRSGTILDILGSVGGLFAILQSIHLLLFGRPLLWGLLGTKLINPFGLVGAFDTKDFSRRLRETYGREPTKDNPDTIQTAAFLRDFVIDFGPLATGTNQGQMSTALRPTIDRQGTLNSMVPLMPIQRENTMEYEPECEADPNPNPPEARKSFDTTP
ncbi:hypothetical protein ACGC1H_002141 [Rhizoctonia solani]|uniref:Transmembrane protein n=1 Tax=Rhizoctonia solani TaxID=456999 RepID=A0A8H3BR50_9AGAM|nr:unnamed protein product [Rhizoctonia solani]